MDLSKCVTFGELGILKNFSIVNFSWEQYVDNTISVSDNTLYVLHLMGDEYNYGRVTFEVSGNKTFAYTSFVQMSNPNDWNIDIIAGEHRMYRDLAFYEEGIFLTIYDFMKVGPGYFCTTTSYSQQASERGPKGNITNECKFSWYSNPY